MAVTPSDLLCQCLPGTSCGCDSCRSKPQEVRATGGPDTVGPSHSRTSCGLDLLWLGTGLHNFPNFYSYVPGKVTKYTLKSVFFYPHSLYSRLCNSTLEENETLHQVPKPISYVALLGNGSDLLCLDLLWLAPPVSRGHHSYARFSYVHASDHLFCHLLLSVNQRYQHRTQINDILPLSVVGSHQIPPILVFCSKIYLKSVRFVHLITLFVQFLTYSIDFGRGLTNFAT